jgi:hypothetical protein
MPNGPGLPTRPGRLGGTSGFVRRRISFPSETGPDQIGSQRVRKSEASARALSWKAGPEPIRVQRAGRGAGRSSAEDREAG